MRVIDIFISEGSSAREGTCDIVVLKIQIGKLVCSFVFVFSSQLRKGYFKIFF